MNHDGEVGVEKEKDPPSQGKLFIQIPSLVIQNVHVDGEGDVLNQDQAVSHGNTSKNEVDRVGPHVLVGEHQDVEHVEEDPHAADHHCQISMQRKISILKNNG